MEHKRIIGQYYGYPECCISFFISKPLGEMCLTEAQKAVHNGEGFIPCPSCAKKVYEGELTINELIKDRVCTTDYPNCGDTEGMIQYANSKLLYLW